MAEWQDEVSPDDTSPHYPLSVSNFITFSDVCADDYEVSGSTTLPFSLFSTGDIMQTSLATIFMEPGPSTAVEGIGSDRVQIRAEGGTFESSLDGTDDYIHYECSPYESAYLDLWLLYNRRPSGRTSYFNVSGDSSLSFAGTLDREASMEIVNSTEGEGSTWKADAEKMRLPSHWNVLSFCVLILITTFDFVSDPPHFA
jgi:hypothetical protein